MLFVATALENATLEDTLPAVEPSRIAAMWEELSGTVDPYITILLLVQTVILWRLGSELGRMDPEKLVAAIKRAREAESASAAAAAPTRASRRAPPSDGWERWLRCFQGVAVADAAAAVSDAAAAVATADA